MLLLLLLVLALRLHDEGLAANTDNILFRVEDRRVLVACCVGALVAAGAHGQHRLLYDADHAIGALLREGHLLFLLGRRILFDER